MKDSKQIFNNKLLVRLVEHTISDSGAIGYFLIRGAPVVNIRVNKNPTIIQLPNGKHISSTRTFNLGIQWLSHHIAMTHTAPGLTHSSLISTIHYCDAGYKVTFDEDECQVHYEGK